MTTTLATSATPVVVAVGPTSTTLLTLDTRFVDTVAAQVTNLDPTQTLDVTVQRRTYSEAVWANSQLADLRTVNPGESLMVDLNVGATAMTRLVGTMSGAGGNVQVSYVRRAAK